MFLFEIPSQYLIIDPSYLPNESLRFFHIDPHWVDALIDGALSIANHINKDDDTLRQILKGAFNAYFATIDPDTDYRPQIPTYGCFLRSGLVRDFPDMHVVALCREDVPPMSAKEMKRHERAPILRQECLAGDMLLCLFDRIPSNPLASCMLNAIMIASNIPAIYCYFLGPSIAFGANFHHACSTAIIVEPPPTVLTYIQAMGRLFRVEQREYVYIIDLHLQFFYDSFLEASNLEKHAHTLATQTDIDVRIKGDYDLYYTRLRVTWDKMYHPLIAREGLFYSALAQFSMENPDHVQHLETKGKTAHIAASWIPGSELTKEHVDGLLPSLGEAGAKLYNFVMDDEE
ncbi:Hypothetical protein NCS54_00862300 [Fusarium falciforme]|uniref:Hypothetical protein n=1 Tax=Fusarium falciforme TaxID=195108 RepID=UPI0023004245|nr:Hypothetical protein NCS54_00862300 [Fusarium falciforme]WAO91166.1 Hypothetical protein NCS54_00862300 [Fusarium falciforme]